MGIKNAIDQMIKQYKNKFIFFGQVEKERINELESELGVKLPEGYKWFLENYGHGGIAPAEILGIAKSNIAPCKRATDNLKKHNLPEGYVIIEDCGEYYHCLDTLRMDESGECPVVNWDIIEGEGLEYSNFLEFLFDRFSQLV